MQRPVEHEEARVARVVVVGGANVDIQGFPLAISFPQIPIRAGLSGHLAGWEGILQRTSRDLAWKYRS